MAILGKRRRRRRTIRIAPVEKRLCWSLKRLCRGLSTYNTRVRRARRSYCSRLIYRHTRRIPLCLLCARRIRIRVPETCMQRRHSRNLRRCGRSRMRLGGIPRSFSSPSAPCTTTVVPAYNDRDVQIKGRRGSKDLCRRRKRERISKMNKYGIRITWRTARNSIGNEKKE